MRPTKVAIKKDPTVSLSEGALGEDGGTSCTVELDMSVVRVRSATAKLWKSAFWYKAQLDLISNSSVAYTD